LRRIYFLPANEVGDITRVRVRRFYHKTIHIHRL
jgi:hypothetical protein